MEFVASSGGRRTEPTYAIIRHEPGELVTLPGENSTVVSLDTMRFSDTPDGGTRVAYEADLALKGPSRTLDPLLRLAFNRVGDRAAAGQAERGRPASRGTSLISALLGLETRGRVPLNYDPPMANDDRRRRLA